MRILFYKRPESEEMQKDLQMYYSAARNSNEIEPLFARSFDVIPPRHTLIMWDNQLYRIMEIAILTGSLGANNLHTIYVGFVMNMTAL